jgi:hypothetical protein
VRVFELTTRINAVQRSQGDSATAKAAYRACCVIECDREGKTHDYSRKAGHEASGMAVPQGLTPWGRSKLWNAAELVERNGKRGKNAGQFRANAQTARDLLFTFPSELSQAGRLNTARIIAGFLVSTSSVAVDFNIHQPGKDGDERNHHCHMMFTTRRMTAKGLGEKTREWDDLKTGPKLSKQLRKFIADTLNAELAAEGKAGIARVEYRSFKDRGSPQKPAQQHQGPGKTHLLRKKQGQARRAWEAQQRRAQRERQGKELASLKVRQDFALQAKLADITRRGRAGAAAIRRELAEKRKADIPPTGIRRVFQIVTRQDMREAFDRQTRDGQRVEAARAKHAAMAAELRAERNAFVTGQVAERGKLTERHAGENRQMQDAVTHRQAFDRAAEVAARQKPEARTLTREQQQEREQGNNISRGLTP